MRKLLALLLFASPVFAQSIPIVNPSFEVGGGWTGSFGAWQPSSGVYTSVPDGKAIGYLNSGGMMTQDLGVAALPSSTYTLTFWAGHRNDGYTASATYQLFAGTTSLCSLTVNSAAIPIGTFAQQTLSCSTAATPPTGDLIISVVSNGTQTDVDDFSLTVAPAGPPPPFVWVMPGLGTATFPMQIPPACGPDDGTCSIQIQVCDTSQTPPVCMTASIGTLSLIKTISLPTPQVQTIPVVVVTNP